MQENMDLRMLGNFVSGWRIVSLVRVRNLLTFEEGYGREG
jgi:hypothetical protein